MELNLLQEAVSINETIFDGVLEQGIESDYVMPDYLPDITRILKCRIIPKIVSKQIAGEKILIDGFGLIKLLYLSEDLGQIHTIEIRVPFSKSQDIKVQGDKLWLNVRCKTDYCNCRAVNQRRIDVRGAISIYAKAIARQSQQIISDANGEGIQLRRKGVCVNQIIGTADKQFTVRQDIETTLPSIDSIVQYDSSASITDIKTIANKIIVKGNGSLHLLYQADNEPDNLQIFEQDVPISQILDLEGVDEECICDVSLDVVNTEIGSSTEEDSTSGMQLQIGLYIMAKAFKKADISVVTDAYSTRYEANLEYRNVSMQEPAGMLEEVVPVKSQMTFESQELSQIYDIRGEIASWQVSQQEHNLVINGTIDYYLLGRNTEGEKVYLEKSEDFEISKAAKGQNLTAEINLSILNCSGSLSGVNTVDTKADVNVVGCIYRTFAENVVSGINLDEGKKKAQADSALTIYFADEKEDIWDIAKRYNTSAQAIREQNELESDELARRAMLLIPKID